MQRGYLGTAPDIQNHVAGTACLQQYQARPGEIILDNVAIGGGFLRNFHLNAADNNYPGGPGIRQIQVSKGEWFGARSPGETIVLNRVVHASFVGIDINPAGSQIPGVPGGPVRQGIKISDSITEQVFFANLYLAGDLVSEAAGSQGDSTGTIVVEGYIAGSVTFSPGSAGNRIMGPVLGTVTDEGSGTPNITDRQPWKAVTTFQNEWRSDPVAIAEYFLDSSGVVHLRGSVVGGALLPGTALFMLAEGYYLPNPASPSLPPVAKVCRLVEGIQRRQQYPRALLTHDHREAGIARPSSRRSLQRGLHLA